MAKPPPAPTPVAADDPPTPQHVPSLPAGVQTHDAGVSPYATRNPKQTERSRKEPPPGWAGTFSRCGWCGDFLGDSTRCPTCAADEQPGNVQMSTVPKMMATK